jgi:DNA-binding SARP family transcriptional activator
VIETSHLLPQAERLVARLRALETPLVQVWGWPGSGKSALLAAFLDSQGTSAIGLSLGDFAEGAEGEGLRERIETAHAAGIRWLVVAGDPGESVSEAARWLRPGQRLVFAGERRRRDPALEVALLPPQELLLEAREVAALWQLLTGSAPSPVTARRLQEASDGWYRPLRLAIDATGGAGLEVATPELLLEIPPVRFFLRHEVLDGFAAEELESLLTVPAERPGGDERETRMAWALLESRGLWLEGAQRDRIPRLLAAGLQIERQRREARAGRSRSAVAAPVWTSDQRPAFLLSLLGSPAARRRGPEGETVVECRLKRSFQVLAYLASSPRLEATRDEVVEAIWPTDGEQTIERNFHPTLSHLRRALEGGRSKDEPPSLLLRAGVYRLNPEYDWEVDVLDLVRRVEEGKAAQERGDLLAAADLWRGAWSLYRGPFLQGHYEAWVAARREIYQKSYLEMLRELGDVYQRLGRVEEAVDAYRSVLVEDPLQEKVHVSLMQLYAGQGRRDMVRRQYDRLCTMLHEELSVAPMPQTTREYHRLMG